MEKSFKRLLSFAMALFMVLSLVPFNGLEVYAADSDAVAQVGDTKYTTIDDAIANWTNGTTLTLLADVTLSDVIKLSSTEHHILDVGTYTMTAAKNKDAIQYVVNGRSSLGYALDIKADATNPGGITATGGSVVRHTKPLTGAASKDRPITRFYGGVFNASYVVRQGGTLGAGYTGASAPAFYFYGGEYNGTIYTNRSINQFYGGTFNGSMQMSVDSSAYTQVAGGAFKNLSNSMGSALTSDKFTIGSSKGANNGSVCVDENGYYVITTTTPTNAEASVASNYNSSNYFYYSTVNTDGMYYEDVYDALEDNKTGVVTVFADVLDLTDTSFKGTIVVPEGQSLTITNAPDDLKTEGNVIIVKPVATIGNQTFDTLQAAIDAVKDGETIVLHKACAETVSVNKSNVAFTIDGNDKNYTGSIQINVGQNVTVKNINFVWTEDAAHDFIANVGSPTGKNYNTTLLVEDCSFTGNGKDNTVAVRTIHPTLVTVKNCTGTGLHSFLQNTGGQKVEVYGLTLTDSKGGLAVGTTPAVTVSGCNLTTRTYGIRLDAALNANATLTDNTVNAYIPVSVRKATAENYQLTIDGESSSYTATNADGKWCAICATEYEEGVALNEPSGNVHVTLNGAGLEKAGVYGAYKRPATGTITYGFTSQTGIWGETTNNASESMMVELYYGDVKIATSQLNNIGGIIDGDVYVTWQMPFAGSTDEYWTVEWAEGYPNKDAQPTKVVLVVDGTAVAENVVQMNGPDNLNPVVWEELEFFKVPVAQTMDAEGNVIGSYFTFEEALAAACADANVTRLEILADSEQTTVTNTTTYYNINQALTIGAPAGESYTVTVAPNSTAMNVRVQNGGSLTIAENVTINHLNVVANGFATTGENMTIEGTLYALSLKQWTNNGTITVTETGKVILGNGDGQFDLAYGNGTVTINGTGDKTVDQFKAGYSGTRGNGNTLNLNNTSFEAGAWFNVNGSNGIFNVNNSVLKVSGGDFNGDLTVTSTGNKINLTNGSELKVGALALGEGNQLKLDATSKVTAKTVTGAGTLVIDATGMKAGDTYESISADLSGYTGAIQVENNNLNAEIVDGKIVLKAAPVASVDGVEYADLQTALKAIEANSVVEILDDITITEYWDARKTGAKITVPVTINGNDHTITFNGVVNDGYNYYSAFRFEAAATVKDLTIDMTNAISEFQGRFRAISAKSDLTVDGCTFIGNGSANNTRAIIFGEGAGDAIGNVVINITDSDFTGWRQGVSDNEGGKQEVKSVTITGNTFTDAGVNVSAAETINFNENTVAGRWVKLVCYVSENLTVNAQGNTLTPDGTDSNRAKGAVLNVQAEFLPPVAEVNGVAYKTLQAAFAAAGEKGNVTLLANVDLKNEEWTPITKYSGTFDGNGYTIKNLKITHPGGQTVTNNVGLIGTLENGTIKNLTIENVNITGSGRVGAVVGNGYTGKIENITVKGNIQIAGYQYVGGITGYGYASIDNCKVIGDGAATSVIKKVAKTEIYGSGTNGYVGGIKGFSGEGNIKVTNSSVSDITITTNDDTVGGISGIFHYGNTFTGCELSNVVISAPDNDGYNGIIAGDIRTTTGHVNTYEVTVNNVTATADGVALPTLGTGAVMVEDTSAGNVLSGTVYDKSVAVAKIGNTYYKDLHEAMVACKSGETVLLISEVDLAGTEWEPVSFKGTFDGQNHTISNLTINKPGVSNTGFITSLNGTFKNVTFTNPTVTGGENTGVVAGRAGGGAALAENITVNGTIKVEVTHSGYARAAVIVGGWAYGNYKNITVDGGDKAVSYVKHTGGGDGRYVGGIVGHADDVDSYVDCTVKNITIDGDWLCGAIAGPGPSDGLASGCVVENVDIHSDYSGGMFGWYYGNGTIENSSIKNVAFTAGTTNNGAIGGYSRNTSANVVNVAIENVTNQGKALLEHVAEINGTYYFTLEEAIAAAQNGDTITLLADIELTDTLIIDKAGAITIDGNGKSITLADSFENKNAWGAAIMIGNSNYTDADTANHTVTVKNATFDGITGNAIIRVQGVTLNMDGCIVKDCDSTNTDQGMLRIDYTKATITNTEFTGNKATKIIGHNHNASGSKSKVVIEHCAFNKNIISGPGVIVLSSDAGCTIADSSFVGNNVTCTNGATVYMGFSENNVVTGNLFQDNVVTGNATSNRIAGALFVGYTNEISGNAFVNNTATNASGIAANDVCVDTIYALPAYGYELDIDLSGNYFDGVEPVEGDHYTVNSKVEGAYSVESYYTAYTVNADGTGVTLADEVKIVYVAQIGTTKYKTLQAAVNAAVEGDTITILAGTVSEGTVKLPATLKNVTLKGAEGAILKDMTIMAADGNSISYEGLTFDGITFENSRISITGWRNGGATVKDLTVTNCTFKNLDDTTNSAPVHINMAATEAVENFTFTNNVIDGATGGQKSGVYAQTTGKTVFTGNTINNVSFRPYVIQITTDDGIADEFIVTGNTFSGSAAGRAQSLGNNAEGTDTVKLVVSENVFKDSTTQQICYWNFNEETTTADLSKNYYDIDILNNPSKIYYNSAAQDVEDLIEMGAFPYYADEAMTQLVEAPAIMVTYADGTIEYFEDMREAVPHTTNYPKLEGATVTLLRDMSGLGMRFMENGMVFDLNGYTYTLTGGTGSKGTETSAFQIRPEVTETATIKNGTIQLAEGVNICWIFNNYATNFVVEDVTVDCANMAYSYGQDCYVHVSRAGDNTQFTGNTQIINFKSEVAGDAINVGGTMTVGENVIPGGSFELDAGATLTAPAGLDVTTNVEGYEVVYENGVYSLVEVAYVAQIGDTKYETFEAALDAAKAAGMTEVEVTLLDDCMFSTKVKNFTKVTVKGTDRAQTLDLNLNAVVELGNVELVFEDLTVSRLDKEWLYHWFYAGKITYRDCKMIGLFNVSAQDTDFIGCDFYNDDSFGDGNYSLWVYNCLEGVEVNVTDCTFDVYERAIKMYGDGYTGNMVLNISGTEFTSRTADKTVVEIAQAQNCSNGSFTLNVTEATYTGFGAYEHTGNDGENTLFNVEVASVGGDVKVFKDTVQLWPLNYVAQIGDAKYTTLQAAIDAAGEGDTVKVLTDIELSEGVKIPAGKTITLDLAGNTISQTKECTASYSMIENKGSLTITGNGKLSFTDTGAGDASAGWGVYTIHNSGTLVVENGTIENLSAQNVAGNAFAHTTLAIFQYSGSTTIHDGKISAPNYRSLRLWSGEVTINGGEFDGQVWVHCVDDTSKLTINGGEFAPNWNDGSSVFVNNAGRKAELTINNGTFNTKIGADDPATLEGERIVGGTFTAAAKQNTNSALLGEGYVFQQNENGTWTVVLDEKYVAWNMQTGALYETVTRALMEAKSGETVQLLKDVDESAAVLTVLNGITLDLNGHDLIAYYVLTATVNSYIMDSTNGEGLLKVAKDNLILADNNEQLKIWKGEEAGYCFASATFKTKLESNGSGTATFRFYLNETYGAVMEELADGAADGDGLTLRVKMTYANSQGGKVALYFDYPQEKIQEYAAREFSGTASHLYMIIRGLKNVTDVSFQAVVASGNVVFESEVVPYNG